MMLYAARLFSFFLLLFLSATAALAQVGPMGIGNGDGSPTPAGPQPKLLLWLDGSSATPYVAQAPVTVWQDKSGNGYNFSPSSEVQRPSLRISGQFSGPKGSFTGAPSTPCVRFIDNSAHLTCPDFALTGSGYSIYFVIRTEQDNFGLFSYSTPTDDREMLIYNDNGIRQQMGSLDRASAVNNLSDDTWNYVGILMDTNDDQIWEYSRDEAYEASNNNIFNGISFSPTGEAIIGETKNALNDYPSSDNFEGYIAEIIVYEGKLTRPATRLLRTYFWIKYGLNGDTNEWDKFNGNMANNPGGIPWGGKYYAPIGIGTENGDAANEARSAGLVLRVNEGGWVPSRTYLCAAPVGNSITGLATNTITESNLASAPTVEERWSRIWEISGNPADGNEQLYQIAFDFGEGITGGTVPQNADNFVLLHRNNATSGNFSILSVSEKFVVDDELVFRVSKEDLLNNGPYYTIGTTDPTTSSLTGQIRRTWYAYQSGNWNDSLTWTLDGSAAPSYVNPNGLTPNVFDDIVIGSGRNVVLNVELPELSDLKVFGTLDMGSAEQPVFETIGGSGMIRCSGSNFPLGNSAAFADPVTGGTLEFYGPGGFSQESDLEVNKLKINLATSAATITLNANLITNGLFEINRGTFVVGNNTNTIRELTSNGTVLVDPPGRIRVSSSGGTTKHKWFFYKDLVNSGGQIRFTNRTASDENFNSYSTDENQHIITAYFSSGSNNQELRANGLSYFSRIVVDKGVDLTYNLSISSNNSSHFKLLGPCYVLMTTAPYSPAEPIPGNIGNPHSFALINGTAEIKQNIFIPLNTQFGSYLINNSAQLWVNGGIVTKGPLGAPPQSGGSGLVIYGKIKVSSGVLNVFSQNGTLTRDNGVLQIDGGIMNTNVFQTSNLGSESLSNLGGIIINGGTMNVDGTFPGAIRNGFHTLSLTYPGNLFLMTGGTLNISGPSNTGLVFINSDPENTNVSGGTVHLDISNNSNNYKISSRATFWNLSLTRSTSPGANNFKISEGTSGPNDASATLGILDLVVRNNFSITGPNNPKLEMGISGTPSDLLLSGNMTIGAGCEYLPNNNKTRFVGNSNSSITLAGSTRQFYNVEVQKDLDSRFVEIQSSGPNPAIDILGNLNIEKGYFVNNNRHVVARGNVINRSQFGNSSGTGQLRMQGSSGRQEIFSDEGVFHTLVINNPDGVALENDGITIRKQLLLTSGSLFIGNHKLRMETANPTPISSFNATNKFIVCSGNASAGGLEILNHSASQTMTYPIGVSTGVGTKYTRADIYINSSPLETPEPDPSNVAGTGGDETVIEENGSFYRVHVFKENGTMNITQGGEVEYLIVAGGGGGGSYGGGGGGGLLQGQVNVTAQSYPVSVGAGGPGTFSNSAGANGSNSSIFSLVAEGGGGGGNGNQTGVGNVATSGGSGGGGNGNGNSAAAAGAAGIAGQGNDGGNGIRVGNTYAGGGGGGAAEDGSSGTSSLAGKGGDGVLSLITGSNIHYAGGGGGGGAGIVPNNGGVGGGGNGGGQNNGTVNTGGGGGASRPSGASGDGGSGVVIVRYEITEEEYEAFTTTDGGYIRITPVDTLLSTVNLSGSSDYLNFYWRVSSTGFDEKPNVTHLFRYQQEDVRGTESNFVSGRVLSTMPFTRSFDEAPATSHVNTSSNQIYYNGPDEAQAISGLGTPLMDADYTAGADNRFPIASTPDIFFSNSSAVGAAWEIPGNWNKLSDCVGCNSVYDYHSASSPASTTDYPEEGDIAVIGFDVNNPYRPHVYKAPDGGTGIKAAQVLFTPLQDATGNLQPRFEGPGEADLGILRPTLEISGTSDIINLGQLSGEGALMLKENIDLGVTDIGSFLAEDSSVVVINNGEIIDPLLMNFLPANVPNLFIAESAPMITTDLRIRGKLEVAGKSRLYLSETSRGNIEIDGDLILDKYQLNSGISPQVLYNKKGSLKTIHVHGDVKLLGTVAYIGIDATSSPSEPPQPWTPEEIGALLWLDAQDPATVNPGTPGSNVTAWNNKASGLYNASQSNTANQPVYQATGLNGLPAIQFDGSEFLTILHDPVFNMHANQDYEIFSVTNQQVNPANVRRSIFAKGQNGAGDLMLYMDVNKYRFILDNPKMIPLTPTDLGTQSNLGWGRRQGNSAFVYNTIGGSTSASNVAAASGENNTWDVSIGASNGGTDRFFLGHIAELILVKRALSKDERDRMEGYLAHKWGLENDLPDGHPYKNNAPFTGDPETERALLIVDGNIIQDLSNSTPLTNGIELYQLSPENVFVDLVVTEPGSKEFINIKGPTPRLWKLTVNKGNNTSSSFTFNSSVAIDGFANEPEKPVNIQNGLLKFNDPDIDITLSSGGEDFKIPNSGGLELNDGQLRITGAETGVVLSGLLKITGGTISIGDSEGANNYIEYAAGGVPKLFVEGGQLTVGSQIRRNLTTPEGALEYRQSGGDVIIGKHSAPASTRGMLEVLNPGSRFEYTGGTLTFVRGVSLASTPSLLLTPTTYNVSPGTEFSGDEPPKPEIFIGNEDSPSGAEIQNFGILSEIPLNTLTINSYNSPVVNLITADLELIGDLTIAADATLNCNDHDLLLNQDVYNDGLLISASGIVNLNHPDSGIVAGSGVFDLYDLKRSGGGSGYTLFETDILVKNNFTHDEGVADFNGNILTVKGDVTTDGLIAFDVGSNGLILDGTETQLLTRTVSGNSEIDILTINNEEGVTTPADFYTFRINKELRLERGKLSLSGNILEMGLGANFTPVNPYSEKNMIVTGGAFIDYGVLVNVPANSTDDVFIPLGVDRFMPINMDFQSGSSGSTASSYLLTLKIPEVPIIEPADVNNVLGMYFSVDGTNIGDGLNVDLKFRYNNQYVQVVAPDTEADYIAARVLPDSTTVAKFGTSAVDEVNNIITFSIQGDFAGNQSAVDGDYFAGIDDAIPDNIPVYITQLPVALVTMGDIGYSPSVPGGNAPSGAIVIIDEDHQLNFQVDGINFYRTEIREGATLKILLGSTQHRLGRVTGTGTLQLIGTGVLPSGNYTDFFGCGGGKLEYNAGSNQNFEILSNMPQIESVTLSSNAAGTMTIANSNVNICNNLIIDGNPVVLAANSFMLNIGGNLEADRPALDLRQGNALVQGNFEISGSSGNSGTVTSGNNGTLTVQGDLLVEGGDFSLGSVFRETHLEGNLFKDNINGSISDGTSGAKLVFNGIVPQTITGDFTGTSRIPTLELDNGTGLTLAADVDISEKLILTDGNIFTNTDDLVRLTSDAAQVEPEGGQPTSFVDGPMQWTLSGGATEKIFPVGNNDRHRPLAISNRSVARTWEVQYTDTVARIVPTIDPLMLPDPMHIPAIEMVSRQEFWRVDTDGGSTQANVRLSWGDESGVSTNELEQEYLLVLAYNDGTDVWDSYGGQDFQYDAPTNRGSLNSVDPIPFSQKYLTLGSSDGDVNPLPVTWLYFDGENKGEDNLLSWATASEINNDYFELERSMDARNWTVITQVTAAGQSNSTLTYHYTDRDAPFGRVYYRLKQVDFDGTLEFAPNIVSLERGFTKESEVFDFLLFPNPTQIGTVRFRMSNTYDERAKVSVSDLSGQLLSQTYIQIDGQGTSAPVNCNFEPGIYLVTVIVNDKMRSKPLVITR